MKKIGWYLFGIILALLVGLVLGWWVTNDAGTTKKVSSQLILTALHDRGFLVTQTYMFNEPVTIEDDDQSFWESLLWGQVVKAHGVVEVNMGIDLANIGADDIEVTGDKVIVTVGGAELFNSRLVGSINVENKQGILKRLFDNDDGYNQALAELTSQAEDAANDLDLIDRANERAVEEISRLLGYVATGREVEVIVKN
jgi:hypothetical protein